MSLENADLTDARFMGARLDGTRFKGAKLNGASFVATSADYAVDFDKAVCNDATALPEGWTCQQGHPAHGQDKLSAK